MAEKHEKKRREMLKVLATAGPSSKWDLAGEVGGEKKKGLTPYSWALVHKLITELADEGLVRKIRTAKGKKHKIDLFGLTPHGFKEIWRDREIRVHWKEVMKKYSKIISGSSLEWIDFSWRTYEDPELKHALHYNIDLPYLFDPLDLLNEVIFLNVNKKSDRIRMGRKIGRIIKEYPHIKKEVIEEFERFFKEAGTLREILQILKEG